MSSSSSSSDANSIDSLDDQTARSARNIVDQAIKESINIQADQNRKNQQVKQEVATMNRDEDSEQKLALSRNNNIVEQSTRQDQNESPVQASQDSNKNFVDKQTQIKSLLTGQIVSQKDQQQHQPQQPNSLINDTANKTETLNQNVEPMSASNKQVDNQLKTNIRKPMNNNNDDNLTGLNLNMTASEMRELLARRKKFDPKKAQINIRQKYEIIQQM